MRYYVYGVCKKSLLQIDQLGLWGEIVNLKILQDLALVISNCPPSQAEIVSNSRENLLNHQQVIENIFAKTTILPIKFGTLMQEEEMKVFLQSNYDSLTKSLNYFENKVELVIKGFWKNIKDIFGDISENNLQIKSLKNDIEQGRIPATQNNMIEIGKMVQDALATRKENLRTQIIEQLSPYTIEVKINPLLTDAMFINTAFLLDKSQEISFDAVVQEIGNTLESEAKFQYFGPAAPANFIHIVTEFLT